MTRKTRFPVQYTKPNSEGSYSVPSHTVPVQLGNGFQRARLCPLVPASRSPLRTQYCMNLRARSRKRLSMLRTSSSCSMALVCDVPAKSVGRIRRLSSRGRRIEAKHHNGEIANVS
eukprot:scaffold1072_cov260-Pinguiococcus_pyrenoidosus.AAC.2